MSGLEPNLAADENSIFPSADWFSLHLKITSLLVLLFSRGCLELLLIYYILVMTGKEGPSNADHRQGF